MKLYPLKSWQEMEQEMLERSRSTVRIPAALIYFGGAILVILLMGYGFGWPQLEEPTGYSAIGPHSDAGDRP